MSKFEPPKFSWGFWLFCCVIDVDFALGMYDENTQDVYFWNETKMILHLSSNLQTQPPVLVQLKCQFLFRVFQNLKVKLPSVATPTREEAARYSCFPCAYLMSFICTFAEHWFIMKKKIRQKHSSSISFTLYIFALFNSHLGKKWN